MFHRFVLLLIILTALSASGKIDSLDSNSFSGGIQRILNSPVITYLIPDIGTPRDEHIYEIIGPLQSRKQFRC